MNVLSHTGRSERCRTLGDVSRVEGDSDTRQRSTPHPTLTMRARLPRLCGEESRGESVWFACVAPSSGPLLGYDDKWHCADQEVVRMRETNSGDIGVDDIVSTSCLGLSDEGHRAILNYQWTTSDPPHGLIVGLAPDQTLRTLSPGTNSSQHTNTDCLNRTW